MDKNRVGLELVPIANTINTETEEYHLHYHPGENLKSYIVQQLFMKTPPHCDVCHIWQLALNTGTGILLYTSQYMLSHQLLVHFPIFHLPQKGKEYLTP
jgi:hypothetical protein